MRGHDAQLRAVLIHHAHFAVANLLINHEIVVDRNTPPVDLSRKTQQNERRETPPSQNAHAEHGRDYGNPRWRCRRVRSGRFCFAQILYHAPRAKARTHHVKFSKRSSALFRGYLVGDEGDELADGGLIVRGEHLQPYMLLTGVQPAPGSRPRRWRGAWRARPCWRWCRTLRAMPG